jgi:acid phosphatase family membrane protein YuiD
MGGMTAKFAFLVPFFHNTIFLAAITGWFVAQATKAFIVAIYSQRTPGRNIIKTFLWETGGMPSSHAALVTSMTISVAFSAGIGSNLFVVSFFVSTIVIRDAVGVRRSSGLQAKSLNIIGRHIAESTDFDYTPVKEVSGHTPLEVVAGIFLGIFIAFAYQYL